MKLYLGIVYRDNKVINHRSLFKIVFNPILRRLFNVAIGSIVDEDKITYSLIKQKPLKHSSWNYTWDDNMKLIKKRRVI